MLSRVSSWEVSAFKAITGPMWPTIGEVKMATSKTTTAVKITKANAKKVTTAKPDAKPAAVRKPRTPKAVFAEDNATKTQISELKDQVRNLQVCNDNQRVIIENMQATARNNADLIEKLQTERDDTLRGMGHVESQLNAALGRNERLQTLLGEKTLEVEKLLSSEKAANFAVQQMRGELQDLQERNENLGNSNVALREESKHAQAKLNRIPSFIRAIFGAK